jgi:hypothetical protein
MSTIRAVVFRVLPHPPSRPFANERSITSRWSPEVRALMNPAATFRELMRQPGCGAWVMLRRPLLLALVLGCTVSLQSSGRLSVRLVTDGIVSFAFIPLFEIAALAVVYARRSRRVPFARVADAFFVANAPWLLWLLAFAVLRSVETPLQATAPPPTLLWTVLLSLIPTSVWSARLDLEFFREVRDLILQRVLGWTGIFGSFLGIAIWAQITGWIGL